MAMASHMEPLLNNSNILVSDGSIDYYGNPAMKTKTGGPKAVNFLLGFFLFGTAALYGFTVSVSVYMEQAYHVGDAYAATVVDNWLGTTFLLSFVGGFLADAWLGRHRTAAFFVLLYFLGIILVSISASVAGLTPPPCPAQNPFCDNATPGEKTLFYAAIYLIGIGYGATEPCLTAFGADQFDEGDPTELAQKSSFFNRQFLFYSCGSLLSSTLLVYLADNVSFAIGLAACALSAAFGMASVFIGAKFYRYQKLKGNPFTGICQVLAAAVQNARLQVPDDANLLYRGAESHLGSDKYRHTNSLRWLDKAAIVTENRMHQTKPRRLCTVNQIEEVKMFLSILPMCLATVLYGVVHMQVYSLFITQSRSMDRNIKGFELPPGFFFTFNTVSAILVSILYEYTLIPWQTRHNYKPLSTTQRTSFGLVFSTLSMLVAAAVESVRLGLVKKYDLFHLTTAPLSAFWVVPQFLLLGTSEVLTYVAMTEFFYEESPDSLRGASSSIFLVCLALGSFLSSALINTLNAFTKTSDHPGWVADNPNQGHLDYFYLVLGCTSALNLAYSYALSLYRSKGRTLDEISDP